MRSPDAPSTATHSWGGNGIIVEKPMVAKYTVVKAKHLGRQSRYLRTVAKMLRISRDGDF
jgi:hypothetical protein